MSEKKKGQQEDFNRKEKNFAYKNQQEIRAANRRFEKRSMLSLAAHRTQPLKKKGSQYPFFVKQRRDTCFLYPLIFDFTLKKKWAA